MDRDPDPTESGARLPEPLDLFADEPLPSKPADTAPVEASPMPLALEAPPPTEPPTPGGWPEDSQRHPLPDRAVGAHRIANMVFAGPASLVVCAVWVLHSLDIFALGLDDLVVTLIGSVLILFFLWRALYWPAVTHRHRAWRLTPEVLDIWEGVLFRRVISVPRTRVQHTEVASGPIQRSHDLATLSVYTAGEELGEIALHGLEVRTADAIRDSLLNREEDHVV